MKKALGKYQYEQGYKFLSFFAYYLQAAINTYQAKIYGLGGMKAISSWGRNNKMYKEQGRQQYIREYPVIHSMNNVSPHDKEYIEYQAVLPDDGWIERQEAKKQIQQIRAVLRPKEKKCLDLWFLQKLSGDCSEELMHLHGMGCRENHRQYKLRITKKARRLKCVSMNTDYFQARSPTRRACTSSAKTTATERIVSSPVTPTRSHSTSSVSVLRS
jgi:hypothetical protein